MVFMTDKQTLDDLNILGRYTQNSVYSLFGSFIITPGGDKLLSQYFDHLLLDCESINRRSGLFRFFQQGEYLFPIERDEFMVAESYMKRISYAHPLAMLSHALRVQFLRKMGLGKEYQVIEEGLKATAKVLSDLRCFIERLENESDNNPFSVKCRAVRSILDKESLTWTRGQLPEHLRFVDLMKYDYQIRYLYKKEIATLLQVIYEIDLYTAVARAATEKKLNYASAFEKEKNFLSVEGLFHPMITDPVSNDLSFSQESNLMFLTGANMAGKSTLMKAVGISIYLAHMGFPVPARRFDFSVKEGLFTSINVSDNLAMGYSHFYEEVRRVKSIAEKVSTNKYLVVLFDELFKGTNVKDAYDATVSITRAFSKRIHSCFVVSTHIVEAGEELRKEGEQIQFVCLPTRLDGTVPKYSYQLQEGISDDRHGMIIIKNEKIIEIIENKV